MKSKLLIPLVSLLFSLYSNAQDFEINQPTNFVVCDSISQGFFDFDLTQKNSEILGTMNPNDFYVTYHETQQDADALINALSSPYTNVTNPQTIFANVVSNTTGNTQQTTFDLVVSAPPILNLQGTYEICDGSSVVIDSGLDDPSYLYSWFLDGFILSGETGPNLTVSQPGFYLLEVTSFDSCSTITEFDVILNNFNTISSPTPLVICDDDDDGFAAFDLQSKVLEITNGIDISTLIVTFHESQSDAANNVNALQSPYTNTTPSTQTIFARVASLFGDCFTVVTMELVVDVNCVSVSSTIINVCEDDPNAVVNVDLTTTQQDIVNGENTADFTFTYYLTQTDADAQSNALSNPETFTINGNSDVIYVRVVENASGDNSIIDLLVNFNLNPVITFPQFNTICGNNEIVLTPFVNGGSGQYTYAWSQGSTNPEIVVNEVGTYSVTVTDSLTTCSAFAEVVVDQGQSANITAPQDLTSCGTNGNFDLTSILPTVLNGLDPNNYTIAFYDNFNNVFSETNAIANPDQYSPTTNPQTVYIRVGNLTDDCFAFGAFDLITDDCPIIVDCSQGPVNTTYCYEINSAEEYVYTSTDGSPLQVTFIAGQVEDTWDELTVLDTDGTLLYSGYGNNGDLTGLTFTSTGDTMTVYVDSDEIFACADQGYTPLNYDVSCIDFTALPNCTSILTTPTSGDNDVNENIDIIWSPATGFVNGYKLSVGITSGGTEVIDNLDVGNVLTYDVGTLDYEITYYVTITAYNDNGDATGCTEQSFTTRANPNQTIICDDGGLNTTYCYGNNDITEFSFQSDSGEPLTIFFNAGATEVNFDEVSILDSDGAVMNPNLPYGNNGDFTGLTYTSSGGMITVAFDSDFTISCSTGDSCCTAQFDFDVFCASSVGIIEVNAFVDANANTIFDIAEPNFSNGYFTYEKNNDGVINTVNSSTGSFQILSILETDVYDITFNLYNESSQCYDIVTSSFNSVSVLNGSTETVDFAVVEEQSCEDLAVYVINYFTPPRPGFSHNNYLVLENLGFTTIASGTVEFTVDPQLVYDGVTSVNPNYQVNDTATGFTLDFVNLMPGDIEYIDIQLTCPASVALGEIVTNTANYLTNASDLVVSNNFSTLSEVVVGSYDPNDKIESHGPRIDYNDFSTSDEWLYYTIRFQNLGTFPAEFVRIDDALDNQLDASTFQMLRASHDYVVTRTGTDLEWFFEDINLPAEQDDVDASQGFVYFRIKPTAGYVIGDIIPNTAAIYFDFNAPVITNRFDTEFVDDALSVNDSNLISFDMFPNPAKDKVTIRLNANNFGNVTVNIIDLQGKKILETQISEEHTTELDIADFQSGLYFVKLNTTNKSLVKKLIIE